VEYSPALLRITARQKLLRGACHLLAREDGESRKIVGGVEVNGAEPDSVHDFAIIGNGLIRVSDEDPDSSVLDRQNLFQPAVRKPRLVTSVPESESVPVRFV